MTGKIIKYSVLILFIATAAFFILFRDKSAFGKKNSSFSVGPEKEITAIEFSDGTGRLRLSKNGDTWMVNNKSEARKSSIVFITRILKDMAVKSPVSPELFHNEIVSRNIKPVRVRVFENRRIIRSFLVYKTSSNVYGNIMTMRDGAKPFIVFVPGNETEIGSAFTLKELFWLPFTVFNLLPSEIKSVTLENHLDQSSSFSIKAADHKFILSDMSKELTGWDTSRIVRFLSYFVHIPFESWDFNLSESEKNSIITGDPAYRIIVGKTNGKQITLTLWERSLNENGSIGKDTDRLLGKTDSVDELFVIRYMDVDPILKKSSYFFP